MNEELFQNRSTIQPKKSHQRDAYTGARHNDTKKRHGNGKYIYRNNFFTYQGEYVQGKKQGKGILKLSDGTTIEANFQNDQIQGQSKITYSDGSTYNGQLHLGQKHGRGVFQSIFQKYQGQWKSNQKQGQGIYSIFSTGIKIQGSFKNNKLNGKATQNSYNYFYDGKYVDGRRQGQGKQINYWKRTNNDQTQDATKQKIITFQKKRNYDQYQYEGTFLNNLFHGTGKYNSKSSNYIFQGQFFEGLPKNYPNQFKIYFTTNVKNQTGQITQSEKSIIEKPSALDFQLEGDSINIYVECVYQGPQYLDENQPSQEQIDLLIKNWQAQNKKNKNPPPMPDFRVPKMKKPELMSISEQSGRKITFIIQKQAGQGQYQKMKIDYRKQIRQKKQQIEKLKQQLKKTEDQDPKKKGGKKQAKTENQFKVNVFKQKPLKKQQALSFLTQKGLCSFQKFELPDDFPQGKFYLNILSDFCDFGNVSPRKIQMNIKSKQAVVKKK